MSQLRYFNAFLLSTLIFLVLYFIFLTFFNVKKIRKEASSKVIKISLITPIKKIIKPIVKAMPIIIPKTVLAPVLVKKTIKKTMKKTVKKKLTKIVEKKVIKIIKPKRVVRKKIVKKKIIKKEKPLETYSPIATPVYQVPKPIIRPAKVAPTQAKNNYHKKAFLRNVRSKIIAHKKYPKIAKRRHIEGSVKIRFDITKHGHVNNIRFINGKRIFQKSIRKTLERSFPMGIPANVKSELPIMNVSVVLHFNIR